MNVLRMISRTNRREQWEIHTAYFFGFNFNQFAVKYPDWGKRFFFFFVRCCWSLRLHLIKFIWNSVGFAIHRNWSRMKKKNVSNELALPITHFDQHYLKKKKKKYCVDKKLLFRIREECVSWRSAIIRMELLISAYMTTTIWLIQPNRIIKLRWSLFLPGLND